MLLLPFDYLKGLRTVNLLFLNRSFTFCVRIITIYLLGLSAINVIKIKILIMPRNFYMLFVLKNYHCLKKSLNPSDHEIPLDKEYLNFKSLMQFDKNKGTPPI